MKFYGREAELSALRKLLSQVKSGAGSRMVSVYGRRRVGKTTLILKALEDAGIPVFNFYTDRRSPAPAIAAAWLPQLCEAYGIRFRPAISQPAEVIEYAMELSKTRPCAILIDECQELSVTVPSFWAALQHVWDAEKDRSQVFLIFSGSIITAMEKIFGDNCEPLFGRLDNQILLRPFSTSLVRKIYLEESGGDNPRDLLFTYAVTGGVARYVEMLVEAGGMSEEKGLSFIFSKEGEWLLSEGSIYLSNEFRAEAPAYTEILRSVAAGATKWNEIQAAVSSPISAYMKRLEDFQILTRVCPLNEKPSSRQVRYGIADPYFRFWLRFIDPLSFKTFIASHRWEEVQAKVRNALPDFLGRTLEDWFRRSAIEDGPWFEVGGWWDRKGENEIDLVAADSSEKRLLFGEVKLNPKKYNEIKLRMKAARFLEANPRFADWSQEFRGLSPEDMLRSL